jgi:hypothetical protein
MRRVVLIVLGLAALAGGAALAQGQSSQDAYELQEPPVTSAQVLRLPSDSGCVRFTRATVRLLPPPGAVLGVLTITADGAEAARMTGVPRAASATIRLTGRSTRVHVSGTTLGGQVVSASRTYRRCVSRPVSAKPKPKPKRKPAPARTPPPIEVGGGEDG